jgi:hypothetical protein
MAIAKVVMMIAAEVDVMVPTILQARCPQAPVEGGPITVQDV